MVVILAPRLLSRGLLNETLVWLRSGNLDRLLTLISAFEIPRRGTE